MELGINGPHSPLIHLDLKWWGNEERPSHLGEIQRGGEGRGGGTAALKHWIQFWLLLAVNSSAPVEVWESVGNALFISQESPTGFTALSPQVSDFLHIFTESLKMHSGVLIWLRNKWTWILCGNWQLTIYKKTNCWPQPKGTVEKISTYCLFYTWINTVYL